MTRLLPTIDLGYPTEPFGQIPAFHNIEEEVEFWDAHEVTDHDDEGWSVRLIADSEFAEQLNDRLAPEEREALAEQARERDMEPSALATVWLNDRLRHELEKKAS